MNKERKIEFRGWLPEIEKMFQFDMWIPWEAEDSEGNTWYTKNMDIMQFTGLKDKNGKDVYEGDILELDNDTFTIQIKYVGCRFQGNWVDESLAHLGAVVNQNWFQWTVVGNIYENPEKLTPNRN